MADQKSWTAIFEQTFAGPVSAVEQRIWREVYGPEFPEGSTHTATSASQNSGASPTRCGRAPANTWWPGTSATSRRPWMPRKLLGPRFERDHEARLRHKSSAGLPRVITWAEPSRAVLAGLLVRGDDAAADVGVAKGGGAAGDRRWWQRVVGVQGLAVAVDCGTVGRVTGVGPEQHRVVARGGRIVVTQEFGEDAILEGGCARISLRLYWTWRSRSRLGRPRLSAEIRDLIAAMSRDNQLWGSERIRGELFKLGIVVGDRSIRRYRWRRPSPVGGQRWRTFLVNELKAIWAADLFVVQTVGFQTLYVFFFITHDRREVVHFNVTASPTAAWIWQQFVNATPWGQSGLPDSRPRCGLRARLSCPVTPLWGEERANPCPITPGEFDRRTGHPDRAPGVPGSCRGNQ